MASTFSGRASNDQSILVVEDEEPIRELVATALRFTGFNVETAMSGREAIVEARNSSFDLIVLDVNLPDLEKRTPLSYAAKRGHRAVVIQLLKREETDVHFLDVHGKTALSYAEEKYEKDYVQEGRDAIVKLLQMHAKQLVE